VNGDQDRNLDKPGVQGVSVILSPDGITKRSRAGGWYELRELKPGAYEASLRIPEKYGYFGPLPVFVAAEAGELQIVSFELIHATPALTLSPTSIFVTSSLALTATLKTPIGSLHRAYLPLLFR